jgi:hypothetical protein
MVHGCVQYGTGQVHSMVKILMDGWRFMIEGGKVVWYFYVLI